MKKKGFFYYKKTELLMLLSTVAVFAIVFYAYSLPLKYVLYPAFVSLVIVTMIFLIQRQKEKSKLKGLMHIKSLEAIEIGDFLPAAESESEEAYQELIKKIIDSFGKEIETHERRSHDMNDYYSTWVHQIKTPIASLKLSLQAEDTKEARNQLRNLKSIEGYVDMVMSYLRLNSEHTDYVIKEENIRDIVKEAVRPFSLDFIEKKLSLTINVEDSNVLTDRKWANLVISQLLSNSLKYTNEGGVTISYDDKTKSLVIEDTGIGIDKTNLPRIFERGYTGFNGRGEAHSSGIGLYICKCACDNLHIDIKCESEFGKYTKTTLTFPTTKFFGD